MHTVPFTVFRNRVFITEICDRSLFDGELVDHWNVTFIGPIDVCKMFGSCQAVKAKRSDFQILLIQECGQSTRAGLLKVSLSFWFALNEG